MNRTLEADVTHRFVAAAILFALAACATPNGEVTAKPRIDFVDVASFDTQLAVSMHDRLPRVEVQFYDRITPSKLPPRLQRWLMEVEQGGGKVAVTMPPDSVTAKNPFLIVSALSSLWSAQKLAREAGELAELRNARKYDAELKLKFDERGEIAVERVVFTPRGL